jgi:hypothetical protein
MATQSDSKVIDRESTNRSLVDRYLSGQAAGGAYQPVQKNVKSQGTNELAVQNSIVDAKYTTTKGFKLGANTGTENFNADALNYSDTINGGVRTDGVDKIATSWNGAGSKAALYTTTAGGFQTKTAIGQSQFNDAQGLQSKQQSLYMKGFNNQKYSNGKFTR